jgi:hypothetical protein
MPLPVSPIRNFCIPSLVGFIPCIFLGCACADLGWTHGHGHELYVGTEVKKLV